MKILLTFAMPKEACIADVLIFVSNNINIVSQIWERVAGTIPFGPTGALLLFKNIYAK